MKRILFICGIALAALTLTSCGGEEPDSGDNKGNEDNTEQEDVLANYKKIDCKVRDLALIYQGGAHRIDWTEDELAPYVTHRFFGGNEEWLFDGFLFLEFTTQPGSEGRQFTDGSGQDNARREDWEWYLDRLFEKGKSLDALNKLIGKKKQAIGDPGFKHKIALTCMVPIFGQTDWGKLDGVNMRFSVDDVDRTKVCKWFIDELTGRFAAGNYENLELYGIYMICENSYHIENLSRNISSYLKTKGLDYLWIPYYQAREAIWKSYGFTTAYLQPNHFFTPSIPDSRLDDTIEFIRENNMAIEFECDERALSDANPSYRDRMIAYIDYFEKGGIWYDTPIAYYTGNHLLLDFAQQPTIQNTTLFDRLCRYIVNRRLAQEKND